MLLLLLLMMLICLSVAPTSNHLDIDSAALAPHVIIIW
jgi:hypothetical protein